MNVKDNKELLENNEIKEIKGYKTGVDPKLSKQSIGKYGEQAAVNYIEKNGCSILERNFRFGRAGELDIIAEDGEYICFIEVKARTGNTYGTPAESVNRLKQVHIRKTALYYIHNHNLENTKMRFDIIEVIFHRESEDKLLLKSIDWIKNVF